MLAHRHERRSSQLHAGGRFSVASNVSITGEILASGHKARSKVMGFASAQPILRLCSSGTANIATFSGTLMFLKIAEWYAFNSVLAFLVSIFFA